MGKIIQLEKTNLKTQKCANNIYRVNFDFENKKIIVVGKNNQKFDLYKFADLYKEFLNSEKQYDGRISLNKGREIDAAVDYLRNRKSYFMLDNSNNILSFMDIASSKDHTTIGTLFTPTQYRGKGYATEMLKFTENIAVESKHKRLCIGVFEKNTVAKSLYLKYGFKEKPKSSESITISLENLKIEIK